MYVVILCSDENSNSHRFTIFQIGYNL